MNIKQEEAFARMREQRGREAVVCLKLAGHDPKLGLLLDLGCGQGYLLRYFQKRGIETVGVDVLRDYLKLAKKKIVPDGSFILADGVKLPFRECFNTVVLNDVLEHVPYGLAKPMLTEIRSSLKNRGKLYISVANRYQIREPHSQIPFLTWFPRSHWNRIYKLFKKRPTYNYYPYTTAKLKKLCTEISLAYENYTWYYAWNKISNINIGDPVLKKVAKTIKRLKLSKGVCLIAKRFSVILFVCTK